MKETNQQADPKSHEDIAGLDTQVRARLGTKRLARLAAQPQCIGGGGIDAVILAACLLARGEENPTLTATVRVLQACGSKPSPEDLKA